ncbi:MAG: YbfB/YjiJ family MFS transporter [Sedimenticola sp.]
MQVILDGHCLFQVFSTAAVFPIHKCEEIHSVEHARSHIKVLIAGVSSLILMLGIARFAYTPLLQVMQDQTWLGDASGGWLATYNYLGYMCGALIAASVSNLKIKDTLYRIGLVLAIVTTAGMALSESMLVWSVMRFLAGLSSAAGLLIGSGLILNWLIRHHHKMELGIHFSGLGLGIVLTAVAVDLMVSRFNWQEQWLVLTFIGVLLAIPAWRWLPRPGAIPAPFMGKSSRTSRLDSAGCCCCLPVISVPASAMSSVPPFSS